jgi:phage/plasmid-like protein (TIGR03299 family)
MSAETSRWLNTMTLQGFTEKRGHAWHYDLASQGDQPNHYPHAIPFEDVKARLFYWLATEGAVSTRVKAGGKWKTVKVPGKKSLSHPETGEVFSIVGKSFATHNYGQWLIDNFRTTLDTDELGIGSAGLLKGGGQAWVQLELPETVTGPGGIQHRPYLTGSAVLDGSRSTLYCTGSVLAVCDNTLSATLTAAAAEDAMVKYAHRKGVEFRPQDIRDRLNILAGTSDMINAELEALLGIKVSDTQWEKFVTATIGKDRPFEAGRGQTNWDDKHDSLTALYRTSPMVAPWAGTGFGALQAVNTWRHHVQVAKNVAGGRPERNMISRIDGTNDKQDALAAQRLQLVLAA